MVESKGWNWNLVKEDKEYIWKNPSKESYYLLNRWKTQEKREFLDLGCGMGRHSILFGKNKFNVSCFDISAEAIKRTKEWAEQENLQFDYKIGDMIEIPYKNEQFDCILCRNVIAHTDTEGIKKVINEIYRVLKPEGECYLTHFYADYKLAKKLFSEFEIVQIYQVVDYHEKETEVTESYHYHLLVHKK